MNIKKVVKTGTAISIFATLPILFALFLQNGISPLLIKLGAFLFYASIIFSLNFLLETFCFTCPPKIKKIMFYIGSGLILLSALIFFNIISFENNLHIITSFGIFYLTAIELHLNGWSVKEQALSTKVIFTIALIVNLFIATILFFQLHHPSFRSPLYLTGFISLGILFYGLYFYQTKHKTKVV